MSFQAGTSLVVLPFSSAHDRFAPSIWRRLFTQALLAEVSRARIKVGTTTAQAASRRPSRSRGLPLILMPRKEAPNDETDRRGRSVVAELKTQPADPRSVR